MRYICALSDDDCDSRGNSSIPRNISPCAETENQRVMRLLKCVILYCIICYIIHYIRASCSFHFTSFNHFSKKANRIRHFQRCSFAFVTLQLKFLAYEATLCGIAFTVTTFAHTYFQMTEKYACASS